MTKLKGADRSPNSDAGVVDVERDASPGSYRREGGREAEKSTIPVYPPQRHAASEAASQPRSMEKSIEYQTNTLFASTTMRGRSILCTRGSDSCRPSKFVMFQVSGAIGMILFYPAWSDLFYRMRDIKHGPIVSWTAAYACSILWQHLLNRTLVWTDLQQGYWESLGGMCVVYFFSLILSSVLNVLFVEVLNIAANFAFFVTAVFTGAVNYVVIAKCSIGDEGQEPKNREDSEWEDENAKEGKGYEDRDIVVDLATNMVSGIQLPSIEMPMPAVELWGKKIQQVTKYHAKHALGTHQV